MILDNFKREALMPLPVTLISTKSADGIGNIAPYGNVMPILRPSDLICFASAKFRDTYRNIKETEEFVINLIGADMVDKVMPTSSHVPPEVDEFELANLEEKPSELIGVSGIKGSYAWMECKLEHIHEFNY